MKFHDLTKLPLQKFVFINARIGGLRLNLLLFFVLCMTET